MTRRRGWGGWAGTAAGVLLVVLGGLAAVPVESGAQTQKPIQSRKLTRELAIMEKIIDQMLLDSQNFLVYSQPETRGLYLEEFGILFSFQASLLNRDNKEFDWKDFKIEDNGKEIRVIPNKNKDKSDKDTGGEDDDATNDRLMKTWERSQSEREAKLYTQGKAEILDVLLDYGDTITSLRDDQWLAIAAYLKGSDYFMKNRISRLLLKAKASDIRAYAAGRLSKQAMLAKVVEEEY